MTSSAKVDRAELETKVQDMYRAVGCTRKASFTSRWGAR